MRFARSTLLAIALALAVSASPSSAKCRFDVPESTMKSAHIVYTGGPGFSPAPVQAQNILRIFVLQVSDECIAEHREWLARMRWERDFKDLFDNAIRWKRETLTKGAAHVYRLSHEFRNRPNAGDNQFDDLSYTLLRLAAEKGHAEAKAELPNRRHSMDEPGVRAEKSAKSWRVVSAFSIAASPPPTRNGRTSGWRREPFRSFRASGFEKRRLAYSPTRILAIAL